MPSSTAAGARHRCDRRNLRRRRRRRRRARSSSTSPRRRSRTATCSPGRPASGRRRLHARWRTRCCASRPSARCSGWCGHLHAAARTSWRARIPTSTSPRGSSRSAIATAAAAFTSARSATARDLVRQLSMHSYAGGKRVFVLGDADFTREAANALLKFFEEPPDGVVLIVTTSAAGRVLPTIRSRLVEVTFPLLAEARSRRSSNGPASRPATRSARLRSRTAARPVRSRISRRRGRDARRGRRVVLRRGARRGSRRDRRGRRGRRSKSGLETVKTLARDWIALGIGARRAAARARSASAAGNAAAARARRVRAAARPPSATPSASRARTSARRWSPTSCAWRSRRRRADAGASAPRTRVGIGLGDDQRDVASAIAWSTAAISEATDRRDGHVRHQPQHQPQRHDHPRRTKKTASDTIAAIAATSGDDAHAVDRDLDRGAARHAADGRGRASPRSGSRR